jgi:hypothetical protein
MIAALRIEHDAAPDLVPGNRVGAVLLGRPCRRITPRDDQLDGLIIAERGDALGVQGTSSSK